MAGKGDKRRPSQVSDKQVKANWDRIFGRDKMDENYQDFTPGYDLQTNDIGQTYQYVDGEVRILSPMTTAKVTEWRDAGVVDEDIKLFLDSF